MILRTTIGIIITLAIFSVAQANYEGGWIDRSGNPVPNRDDLKSIRGFGGWLVVTPDSDWEAKWNTPKEHVPNFSTADEVKVGEVLTILPLFINPKPDANGVVQIQCDIRIVRPDQSISIDEKNLDCFKYKLSSDPRSIWLSTIIPKYVGDPTDPKGSWQVEVVLRDMVRNVEVPLKTRFTLIDD